MVSKAQAIAAMESAGDVTTFALAALKLVGWGAGVLVLAVLGWAASSLHVLAAWPGAALGARLEIVRGVLASVVAGALAALGGLHYEAPTVIVLICVLLAGYSGERWLRPLAEAAMERVAGALRAIGGNGNGGPRP